MHIERDFPRQVRQIENAWIQLSDGARLAARIWLPADAEKHPVPAILEYIPYRKDDWTAHQDAMRHPYFAGHGYAAVRVDIRGTGDSDGVLLGEYLPQEQDDALEVLAWLAEQPWCTGRVGMIGYSWGGFAGLQVAARRPPELGAIVTICSTDDRYLDDCHYMGGCLLASDMLKWASTMQVYAVQPPDPRFVGDAWRDMWRQRLERTPVFAEEWISHQRRDEFWRHGSVAEDYSAIECPVLAVGGWADAYTNAIPRLLEKLRVPRAGIIGPWGHMFPEQGVPGPAIGFLQECVRWFDRWLKGSTGSQSDPPMLRAWIQDSVVPATFHARRPGRWITEHSWPPTSVRERTWALHPGGSLVEPDAVSETATPAEEPLEIRGDEACGETAGVWCANGLPDELPDDQAPDDERSLTFTSEPLDSALDILGRPLARLSLASDVPQALVAVRLCDVDAAGESLLVSWGLLNLTHGKDHASPQPLTPTARYRLEVPLNVAGHRFLAGHRIRVAISPSYWPHAWPAPRATILSVFSAASALVLPVRESDAFAEMPIFGEPEISEPLAHGHDQPHTRSRTRTHDLATGVRTISDREEHLLRIPPAMGDLAETHVDEYRVVAGDPLSATVRCERAIEMARDGWTWRIEEESAMTCDATSYRVTTTLRAFEGETQVFGTTREREIARDFT